MKTYPDTIEHRWDILYKNYPEIYDRFISYPLKPSLVDYIVDKFKIGGCIVVDCGSGTGRRAAALAKYAKFVIGVEREHGMLTLAVTRAKQLGVPNISFIAGSSEAIPVRDTYADFLTSITAGLPSLSEAKRVLKRNGMIVCIDIAPGFYGGNFTFLMDDRRPEPHFDAQAYSDNLVKQNFLYFDVSTVQEFDTRENILSTFGFIYGERVRRYLMTHNVTSVNWTYRIHYLSQSDKRFYAC